MAVRELSSPPSLTTLYPRALAGSTARPVLRHVPILGRRFGGDGLPDLEIALSDAAIDRDRLAEYDRVCGFRLRDQLPATYPHLLAFPLAMELMTDGAFPFGVLGLVHIRNRITQLRPIGLEERLAVHVRAEGLEPHDRGTAFDIVAEASAGGQWAWRSTSTYLHKEGGGGGGGRDREDRQEPPSASAVWQVPGDIGRRYGSVSGDRNPIHMHPLSARLFGLPRPIAHGMWLKARCLAALESTLPETYTVDVRFKLPVYLPGRIAFESHAADGGRAFSLHDAESGKPHLEGTIEAAREGAARR